MDEHRLAILGECMLEISSGSKFPSPSAKLSFGGDTLNTAVYASRMGAKVEYVTALGDDPYSHVMKEIWQEEGVGTDYVHHIPDKLPGIYAINTDENGERNFVYWRDDAPVRQLFHYDFSYKMMEKIIKSHDHLYFTGITLSLFDEESLDKLASVTDAMRDRGGKVVFDLNFRARGWRHDYDKARDVIGRFLPRIDIAITGIEDEKELWNEKDAQQVLTRYKNHGTKEIVIKRGISPTIVSCHESYNEVSPLALVAAVDTTAAGDSFNGAYLAARLSGVDPEEAVIHGQACAAEVIQHPGAIISRGFMDKIRNDIQNRNRKTSCQSQTYRVS